MSREFSLRTNAILAVLIASCLATFRPALCSQNPSTLSIDSQAELELLLNPRALVPSGPPATLDQLRSLFADPPADFRPMPLWVWNDELQWPRLREQLAQFKQQGMGGVFIHPRPGLMTEYLSPQWFDLWRQSMEEGRRLGLLVNIYDENSYPSGFSGGHVPALAPDTVSQFVQVESDLRPEDINFAEAELVAVFAVEKSPDGSNQKAQRIRSPADYRAGQALVRFRLRRASGNPWTAGFPYVDLTNPQTAPLFISTTFEPYKSQFGGQFGKTIKWAFDDEPLIAAGGAYDSSPLAFR